MSLADLDMPVVVPRWIPVDRIGAAGGGKGSVGGYWDDVQLQPLASPADWTVRTLGRRGRRPVDGGWTLDAPLESAAATAIVNLLLQQIPSGLPPEEVRRRVEAASDTGDAVGERLTDEGAWGRTTAGVDGHAFVLWLHERGEGFAAVADLGICALACYGRTPPPAWEFSLLWPDAARAALDR